jgi:hypothetical protein
VIDPTHTARRRAGRVFLIPAALAAVVLTASWLWPFLAPLGPVRAAQPIVGPAETITLPMRPGDDYLIYHSAPLSEVGRDCRFGSPGHIAGGIGIGGVARSDVAYRGVSKAVTVDGQTFHLAFRVDNSVAITVPISCASGPVLAEKMPAYTGQALAMRNLAIAVVALSTVGATAWWLARLRRARRER